MNSNEIRKAFLDFFDSKNHKIVPSAPMVIKNDPTLMFTNAGMNQFKDIFIGNQPIKFPRIADSQKCLRVSGKHNDLEEVGKDTYHHTMFEMLGNWSFGDYFKKEAIQWAWEFLVDHLKLDPERMYASYFEGDQADGLEEDTESKQLWAQYIPKNRILPGNKKDNFWEMGDTGPCGPCSEIHVDLRDQKEREEIDGATLINKDHPLVIEIWNLVFIQYNRTASGELQKLPKNHVDTGMGFERLCMAVQGKKSNYDTDVFQPLIQKIAHMSGKNYGVNEEKDIAMRVIADHLRAVSFAIADGQLPSNTGAGYVIRRILRRAIRYGYTFLNINKPFIYQLVPDLVALMGEQFTELKNQQTLIEKVIQEEENSFLQTLAHGIQKFENYASKLKGKEVDGDFAFELYDTYGFPIDLTQLLASEKGLSVDMDGFNRNLEQQKSRSRAAATLETEDWVELIADNKPTQFLGYQTMEAPAKIVKYRLVKTKGKQFFQIVLDQTPFYAEAGGQVGDTGLLRGINDQIEIVNTLKENDLTIHIANQLPENLTQTFNAEINKENRLAIQNNHSATHLLHAALRKVLGNHVEQKGSLVAHDRFRFDFSHFSRVTDEELKQVEMILNQSIRDNTLLTVHEDIEIDKAKEMGAMALFGEKYGDRVRVVQFGESVELCGGTHTPATGNIGMVKIISESAIAAGVRRIEAVSGKEAELFVQKQLETIKEVKELLNTPNLITGVNKVLEENHKLHKQIEQLQEEQTKHIVDVLLSQVNQHGDWHIIQYCGKEQPEILRQVAYQVRNSHPKVIAVLGTVFEQKPNLIVALSDQVVQMNMNASQLVKIGAPLIQGGGGGQPNLAMAGGKNGEKINEAIQAVVDHVLQSIN
ncbi:MAG TPA: alanine--tRNA ligase [Bacteroidales bacterium]|nr:alanine--tRNA ligase [Bacteroidales bacterium]